MIRWRKKVAVVYAHPAHPDKPASSGPTIHQGYFLSLQREAKYIKASLDKNAEPNSSAQETISGKFKKIKEDYDGYEKPYRSAGQTGQLTGLLINVNAAAGYWAELLRAFK
jgi:hypothetical protein